MERKHTTIRLDEDVLLLFKLWCVNNNTTMQKVIEQYVKKLLNI